MKWSSSVTTSTPRRNSALCSRPIAFSLPGMMRDEKITTSPSSSTMFGWSSRAMRASAARGSPWLPGADQHDLVARDVARLVLGQKLRHVGEIAVLARRLVHAPQRAPDQRHVAVVGAARHARSSTAAPHSRRSRRPRPARHSGRSGRSGIAAARLRSRNGRRFSALVESQTIARMPSSPISRSRSSSVGSPISGSGSSFQSPVCNTVPAEVRITTAFGSGIEWVSVISSRSNGPIVKAARHRHGVDRDPVGELRLDQLGAQQRGGERRRPDRALQLRPEIGDGADMVLVRVRRDDAEQPVAAFDDKGRVGHDHIDPGLVLLLAEGDAAIDDQPLAAIAVEIEVHPDLAGPAERQEIQRVGVVPSSIRPCGSGAASFIAWLLRR